jgi:integrase
MTIMLNPAIETGALKAFSRQIAEKDGELLDINPLRRCKVTTPYISSKFSPTLEQVNAVLTKVIHPRQAQFAVLAFTGLRVGEMSMLRPSDVDMKGGWIHVVRRPRWIPKTRQSRKIPVHPRLRHLLRQYTAAPKDSEARACFFSDQSDGSRPIDVREINLEL